MKWFAAALVIFLLSWRAHADATLYGAWYTTVQTHANAPKDAGGLTIFLRGNLTSDASGPARFIMTVDSRGTQIVLNGSWQRGAAGRVIVYVKPSNPGDPLWRGSLVLARNQCSGGWRMEGARGSFMARKE